MAKTTKSPKTSKSPTAGKRAAKTVEVAPSTKTVADESRAPRDIPQEITNRIIAALEKGTVPWVKPWRTVRATTGSAIPSNYVSGRSYSGVNVILLWIAREERGFSGNRWLTYKQAKAAGGHVREGETGTRIVYYGTAQTEAEDGTEKSFRFLKGYTVFNEDQCEGLTARTEEPVRETAPASMRDPWADAFLVATGADIREGHSSAYYLPSRDFIVMPAFRAFEASDAFYNTAFHETVHWTGAPTRLDRDLSKRFGTEGYAVEELVAEMSAAFLCAEFGFDGTLRNASYIATWLKVLREDKTAITRAAAAASKAHTYLRDLAIASPDEAVPAMAA